MRKDSRTSTTRIFAARNWSNVAGGPATARDYYDTVTRALGVEPVWEDGPAWTGRIVADRARRWGWSPTVDLAEALREVEGGLRR